MHAVAGSGRGVARSRSADDSRDDGMFYSPAARAALKRRHFELPSTTLSLATYLFAGRRIYWKYSTGQKNGVD